jgi:EAL domain-containing protein (putative c-di-GMP-specific phosphodiesterase class I)
MDEQGPDARAIAVKVFMHQLLTGGFSRQLDNLFRELGIPPSAIDIEIAESAAMSYAEATARTLNDVRDIGTHVAIDDVGTGYSSFAYRKRCAPHKIKIDQSFHRPHRVGQSRSRTCTSNDRDGSQARFEGGCRGRGK